MHCDGATWVILAGGQAQRMGGNDKGLLEVAGKPLIEHVISCLLPQVHEIVINANRHQECYQHYAKVFGDELCGYPGPLGGIQAAFAHLPQQWLGFVPCDCPQLPPDLVARMYAACQADTDIAIAHDGNQCQPVIALINRRIGSKLNDFLARGERKIILLYRQFNLIEVDFSDQPQAFINLNTPVELEQFAQQYDSH